MNEIKRLYIKLFHPRLWAWIEQRQKWAWKHYRGEIVVKGLPEGMRQGKYRNVIELFNEIDRCRKKELEKEKADG